MGRLLTGLVLTALGALTLAPAAGAAAPAAQRAALTDGTAILRYSEAGGAAQAEARRAALKSTLARAGLKTHFLEVLPMAAVTGSAEALRRAARAKGVVAAHPNRPLAPELYQSTPLIYGGQAEELAALGYDGSGVNIAVVDTGVDGLHADLADHMPANFKVVGDAPNTVVQPCAVDPCDYDENGHGSHVAGIAAGDGTDSAGFYRGVAPGAGVVGYAVGAGPSILFAVTAYDHVLAHPELDVVAVNSSFGVQGGGRFDSADPINQGTKRLHEAGIVVVFSNGNSGKNTANDDPHGASDCSTVVENGTRVATDGACVTNPYSVAPWVMSAGGGRKDASAPPGEQHLSDYSARGDPEPEIALSGETIDYAPTLVAPGTNVRSIRDPTATDSTAIALTGDPASIPPPAGGESYETSYTPLTGTSMAAPHLTGAVAVVQAAARDRIGRLLTPEEVEDLVTDTAQPMTGIDAVWDFPCAPPPSLVECGETDPAFSVTGQPYEHWQVGAGYLDVQAAIAAVQALPLPPDDGGPDGPGGPGGNGDPDANPACRDQTPPRAKPTRVVLRGQGLRVKGRARDRGCGGRIRRVRVAIALRVAPRRCRFTGPRGGLGPERRCQPGRYLRARGTRRWRRRVEGLPDGRYLVWARAVDRAGNRERLRTPVRVRIG